MNRQQKEVFVSQLKNDFDLSGSQFLIDYRGMTVEQMQALREQLRAKGGVVKVGKVRLMKRAIDGMDKAEVLMPYLKDQLALVFSEKEAPVVAKVLYDFAKENEQLKLVAGCMDSELLTNENIVEIAKLPSKDALYGQLCGLLNAPTSRLVYLLNMPVIQLLCVIKKIGEQKEQ